ncbi:halocyanin domain-containing protein [Halorubrum sp. AD140]|uniref:halocyanin domain-containing protein n=1 Tax=Halorubrum sp. AD140 TaxID=3050073 RepID=UPI002ACC949B|nr:halocyanin domain-containing protein [Halorubrum sp. AD140]MDZ5810966.1 halocyanin domain-containing protein [Halorubrum sp. AD140]
MSDRLSRRRYVAGTGAALALGTIAGCSGGGDGGDGSDGGDGDDGSAEDDVPSEIDEYLSDAQLYEGTIADHTGEDEVSVAVGAGDTGFAFDPPALRIDAGTTVVWEWTGEGGAHNVASVEDSAAEFNSGDAVDDEGETFEETFEEAGIQLYVCTPHEANGMLGAIEVVES